MAFEHVATIDVDPVGGHVYEHGWQSWSPTTTYALSGRPFRPTREGRRVMNYRPEQHALAGVFQGEGLLAVQPAADAPVHVVASRDTRQTVPTIRARLDGSRVAVSADGPVDVIVDLGPNGIDGALARWADGVVARLGIAPPTPAPTTWCSWYQYYAKVAEQDVLENLDAIGKLDLPIDVVQLDDGFQAEIGDWLSLSSRFRSVEDMVSTIRASGRRAGIWVAPYLVGERSQVASRHPDWLVGEPGQPVSAGRNWQQELYVLDPTHPDAAAYLDEVFATFRTWGIDFFKIDFIYAGAITGRRHADVSALVAYRTGLEIIRRAIGDAYLLGCGAPILPSLGLVDAMRISADTGPLAAPPDGDWSQPSSRAATLNGVGRAFQHGRFWVNDPDCLIVRPAVEDREDWARHVARYGGLRSSSDRLIELDEWGLATTRTILSDQPPATFVSAG
jgi:alpha-galactosidase